MCAAFRFVCGDGKGTRRVGGDGDGGWGQGGPYAAAYLAQINEAAAAAATARAEAEATKQQLVQVEGDLQKQALRSQALSAEVSALQAQLALAATNKQQQYDQQQEHHQQQYDQQH